MPEQRPEVCTELHLKYLDELRESGVVNMFGAVPHLVLWYPELSIGEATSILLYWMHTFSVRHPKED